MADARNLVCIVTPADLPENLSRLEAALTAIGRETGAAPLPPPLPPLPAPHRVCTGREALLSPGVSMPLAEAEGAVCARPVTPYPPGVPVLWPGEEITRAHIVFLTSQWYNMIDSVTTMHGTCRT